MRGILFLAGVLAAFAMSGPDRAAAEVVYPWCAHHVDTGGSTNCGFVSFEQCLASEANRAVCINNPRYQPPAGSAAGRPYRINP
jgi:hypothetical protein